MKNLFYLLLLVFFASCSKGSDPAPAATSSFTMSTTVAEVGEPIQLTSTSQNATRLEWRLSDNPNNINVATNPVASFSSVGTYAVTLTVYNSEGKSSSSTQSIKVGKRYLKEIRITSLNFLNGSGTAWDIDGSGPDVYVTLKPTASTAAAGRTITINNVQQNSLPLSWTSSGTNTIELTKEPWTFAILDEDAIGSDYMNGWSVGMNILPPPARDAFGSGVYTLTNGQFTMLLFYETK